MMHSKPAARSYGFALAIMSVVAMVLGWPQAAQASHNPPSTVCPTMNLTVTRGGSVQIDDACDTGFGIGFSLYHQAAHGTAVIVEAGGGGQIPTIRYDHDGTDPATTDSFVYDDGSNREVLVNLTIEDATGPLPLDIDPSDLPTIYAGKPYSQQLSASGGTGAITYALKSGSLPVGISLGAGGLISGTTTSRFDVTFTIEATDSTGLTGEITYSEDVEGDTLTLSPTSPPDATVNQPYSVTFSTGGGVAPRTVVLASGSLPPGLSLSGSNGHTLSGTPTALGGYTFQVDVQDSSGGFGTQFTRHTVTLNIDSQPTIAVAPATLADGTVSAAYSQTVSGSGGTTPYTFAISAGSLPAGLSLNAATGAISGTPSAGGTSSFTIRATDDDGFSGQRAYAPNFAAPNIAIAPATLPDGTSGAAYSQVISAGGGTAPYSYAVSAGSLPTGLNLDANGQISGTPTAAASFNFDVTVTDSTTGAGPYTDTVSYTVVIASSVPVANPVSATVAYGSGANPITLNITGGTPTSVAVVTPPLHGTATVSGTTINYQPDAGYAGTDSFDYTASNADGTSAPATVSLQVGTPSLSMSPAPGPALEAPYGQSYSETFTVSGGTAPYTYTLNGTLPTGMSFDSSTGTLSGIPTQTGFFQPLEIKATDSSTGPTAPYEIAYLYRLHVLSDLDPSALPDAVAGAAYNQQLSTTGGIAPYTYSMNVGTSLPPGLNLAANGHITGIPTASGNFNFNIQATDSNGISGARGYSFSVAAPPLTISLASLPDATAGVAYSQAITVSGGNTPYSYAITAGALPPGIALDTSGATTALTGTPSTSGSYSFDLQVTDSTAGTAGVTTMAYTLQVQARRIVLSLASLPGGTVGQAYSQSFSASGGIAPYQYTVAAGALPDGLSLDANSGVLSGTPTTAATFSFDVKATDSGGVPASTTVSYSVTIVEAAPVAADDAANTIAEQAVTIDVTDNDSGVIDAIVIDTAPQHGSVTVTGVDAVYTPAAAFFGSDSFTYIASGPGGSSPAATVTITVTPLAVPTAVAHTTTAIAGTAVTIHTTQGASGGPFTAVAVASQPASGTATVSGENIIYTPAIDAAGSVSFTYTLANAFGVSQPATITVEVHSVPRVVAQTVNALAGTTVQVELTKQATGGPFTDADLISVSPATAGSGTITKSAAGYRLDFAVAATYAGAVQIHFTLSNAYATSAPGLVTVNVTARPDPAKDAEVLGVLRAQVDATRRFATGQISNFQRRLESLHGNANNDSFSNSLSLMSDSSMRRHSDFDSVGNGDDRDQRQRHHQVQPEHASTLSSARSSPSRQPSDISFWTGGAVNFGTQQDDGSQNGIDFSTTGISFGADKRLSQDLALGIGIGYGYGASDVGHNGSRSSANSYNVAIYASFLPAKSFYVDGLIGYQWLLFDTRRYITANGNQVSGQRSGTQWFGSLSTGYEYRSEHMLLSPYGRLDVASATLDSYTEHGDALYSLRYDEQTVKTTTGSLGLRMNFPVKRDFGMLIPQLRVEYRHDFQGSSTAVMRYADLLAGPHYRAEFGSQSRNHTMLGLGLQVQGHRGLLLRAEYQSLFDDRSQSNQSVLLGLEMPFNP